MVNGNKSNNYKHNNNNNKYKLSRRAESVTCNNKSGLYVHRVACSMYRYEQYARLLVLLSSRVRSNVTRHTLQLSCTSKGC